MTRPTEGIHPNIPNATYQSWDAVSRSMLAKLVTGTPADLRHSMDNPKPPTANMLIGSLTDDLVYGVGLDHYLIRPAGLNLSTKAGKAWAADHADDARERVTAEQVDLARAMVDAVMASPLARQYLGFDFRGDPDPGTIWQSSHVWTDPDTGLLCRCRPDSMLGWGGWVSDLKTTEDASHAAFLRTCENYAYHLQAAYYLQGCNATKPEHIHAFDRWAWVVVSRRPPHRVEVYECGQAEIQMGHDQIKAALRLYQRCMELGIWPGSSGQVHQINYRSWAMK